MRNSEYSRVATWFHDCYACAGSSDGVVDILYLNPLVSRIHAAIQFNSKDEPFLVDLESTHGTWKGGNENVTNQCRGGLHNLQTCGSDSKVLGNVYSRPTRAFLLLRI